MGKFDYITNWNPGIGDNLSCMTTHLPYWSPSPHFKTLRKYSSLPVFRGEGVALRTELLHGKYIGQHLFNKARIEAGDEPLKHPKPILDKIDLKPVNGRVCFSFSVGAVQTLQKATIHPRARELYPENREIVQNFFNKKDFEFIEVGTKSFEFDNVTSKVGIGLDETIKLMGTAQYFLCITSGLQHLAGAMDIPVCSIINFPTVEEIVFGESTAQELDWLEPHHYYLHQDGESCHVNKFNKENLEKFFNG